MESKKFNNELVQCALCVVKNSGIYRATPVFRLSGEIPRPMSNTVRDLLLDKSNISQ